MKGLVTLSCLCIVSSSLLTKRKRGQSPDSAEGQPLTTFDTSHEIGGEMQPTKTPVTEFTFKRFLTQSTRMFKHRASFLSHHDLLTFLANRLCASDDESSDLVDLLTENSRAPSRESAIDRFITANTAELQCILRRLYTLDLKAFSVTSRPADDVRLVHLKRVLQAYVPHCGHPLFPYLPYVDRQNCEAMFPAMPLDKYSQIITSGPLFDTMAERMRKHMKLLSMHKSLPPRCKYMNSLDDTSSAEVSSMGGCGIYAVFDREWTIKDFNLGGSCMMKNLRASTYHLIASLRTSLRVDDDKLLLARPLDKNHTVLFTGADLEIKQVEKGSAPGCIRAIFTHGTIPMLVVANEGKTASVRKLPVGGIYKLDGDIFYAEKPRERKQFKLPMMKGAVAAGVYPTTRLESDKRLLEYHLERYHPRNPTSYALVDASRYMIVDTFAIFCRQYASAIRSRKDSTESSNCKILCEICESIDDRSKADHVWSLIERLIHGQPYSSSSIRWFLKKVLDK